MQLDELGAVRLILKVQSGHLANVFPKFLPGLGLCKYGMTESVGNKPALLSFANLKYYFHRG